jgi:hypothetical protein
VVVELKQWSQANLWEDNDALVEIEGARNLSSHPSIWEPSTSDISDAISQGSPRPPRRPLLRARQASAMRVRRA